MHVVIVGGGFGGLKAAKHLHDADVRVTLIDRSNHHTFQPLLYQVATAGLSPADIAQPIRGILRGHENVDVVMGEVTGLDLKSQRVLLGARSIGFDVLVLDAYSSDSIPLHLLTREAVALYLRVLKPAGVVALHVSNRYFDLGPVLGRLAAEADLTVRLRDDGAVAAAEEAAGKTESRWAVLARTPADLQALAGDPRWRQPPVAPAPAWSDDRASALEALADW